MLSRYFYLKPYPSWLMLILINTILALMTYLIGIPAFFEIVGSIGIFLLSKIRYGLYYDRYFGRIFTTLLMVLGLMCTYLSETWLVTWYEYGNWITLLLMVLSSLFSNFLDQRAHPKIQITPQSTIIAPFNSLHLSIYSSTILFGWSYTLSLCLLIWMVPTGLNGIQWLFVVLFVGLTAICVLARQNTFNQKQRIDAQGGEWIHIDSSGIQMQSWQTPHYQNGLKQSGIQKEFFSWKEILRIGSNEHRVVAVVRSPTPHYQERDLFIPLIQPFQNLHDLKKHLQELKKQFG